MTYDIALDALGDPTRRAIVALLRTGPRSVGRLARVLPVSRPAVSQHLKILSSAGLLDVWAEGNRRIYSLAPEGFAALRDALDAVAADARSALTERVEPAPPTTPAIEPIVKIFDMPISSDRAFIQFTEGLSRWWPMATHSLSAAAGAVPISVEIEGGRGGQVVETLHDGRRAFWGTVTEWLPGRCFAMTWHVGRPATESSQLTVLFEDIPTGSRVTFTHDNWQNLGEAGPNLRENYQRGWDYVLAQYRAFT